jgi:hypothetical protein
MKRSVGPGFFASSNNIHQHGQLDWVLIVLSMKDTRGDLPKCGDHLLKQCIERFVRDKVTFQSRQIIETS